MDSIGGTIDFEIHCFQRTRDRADDPLLVIDDQYTAHETASSLDARPRVGSIPSENL